MEQKTLKNSQKKFNDSEKINIKSAINKEAKQ